MLKRVLVTGASGLLGHVLVPRLRESGCEVMCHALTGHGDIHADLTDWVQTEHMLELASPQVIVNLAALTDVDFCEAHPAAAYRVNVNVVENLAKWVRERHPECRLVQLSTDQVYDGSGPHRESAVMPGNYYAFSKYTGELAALSVAASVIRTNFFGRATSDKRKSFSDWIAAALGEGRAVTVFDDISFSPLTMPRLSDYIALIIERPCPGVFNLGSRSGLSKADFAWHLALVLGLPTVTMVRGSSNSLTRAYRPKDMRMNCERYESTYGLTLPTLASEIESLAQGVRHGR